MALLQTPAADLAFKASDFALKNIDGKMLSLTDVRGPNGTVIAFICNHCPYVKAIITRMVEDFKALQNLGIGCAAIMPNDTKAYPDDSFENMQKFAKAHNFTFPYLIDETQSTAKAYGAVCTPDLFGFDADDRLVYRGRLDSAGPNAAKPDTIRELLNAMQSVAKTHPPQAPQRPSMGCSIKWKPCPKGA
jgi:peroxiredoxin